MSDYLTFIKSFHQLTGLDLSLYKEEQMKRRLDTFREKKNLKTFQDLVVTSKNDPRFLEELLAKITINVTEFYRNFSRWQVLEKEIIPEFQRQKKSIKIWSAACSTGEEPYTTAMILSKHYQKGNAKIIATDIDKEVLDIAKKGEYYDRSMNEMPNEVKKQFFDKDGELYRVKNDIKNLVTFKQHNLLRDHYETGFDIIICRNVMIYFTEEAREQIYRNFNKALNPGGILFVGSAEQIHKAREFGFESATTFFYRKIN